tara:strand:+ start:4172 stop:4633 length:462 start_codon:yes stop_codon:yes gene_type:complete
MLCCNGTTIGFVQLEKNELMRVKKILEIEEEGGNGFILQPCKKLGCNGCTIYNERPLQCVKFECELLSSIKEQSISFSSAIEIIEDVKRKKKAIEKMIEIEKINLTSKSFYFKAFELRKKMLKTNRPSDGLKHLISQLEDLNLMVTMNFGISF